MDAPTLAAEWEAGRALPFDRAMDEAMAVATAWATTMSSTDRGEEAS